MLDRYGCCFSSDWKLVKGEDDKGPTCSKRCPDALSRFIVADNRFNVNESEDSNAVTLSLSTKTGRPKELQLVPNILLKPKIILILESPHRSEFGEVIAPARGTTGEKIRMHTSSLFKKLTYGCYRVAIVNAIQYQCSFGKKLDAKGRKQKNERFVRLFSMATYKESFKRRLWEVYNPKVDILINCRTKGDCLWHNKDMVWGVVDEVVRMYSFSQRMMPIYSMNHPRCWTKRTDVLKVSNVEESEDWHDVKFIYPCRTTVLGLKVKEGCQ